MDTYKPNSPNPAMHLINKTQALKTPLIHLNPIFLKKAQQLTVGDGSHIIASNPYSVFTSSSRTLILALLKQ